MDRKRRTKIELILLAICVIILLGYLIYPLYQKHTKEATISESAVIRLPDGDADSLEGVITGIDEENNTIDFEVDGEAYEVPNLLEEDETPEVGDTIHVNGDQSMYLVK